MTMCDNERTPSIIEGGAIAKNKVEGRPKTLCLLFKKFNPFISWLGFPKITFWEKPVASPERSLSADGQTDRHINIRTGFVGLWPLQFFYSLEVRFFFNVFLGEYWERFTRTLV